MKIKTECHGRFRAFGNEWTAYDEDAYDVCEDPACGCRRAKGNRVGHGDTEREAIDDLLSQREDLDGQSH